MYTAFTVKTMEEMGVFIPKIMLPRHLDTKTWSVIACDQYTQDKSYWKSAEDLAGNRPSTLRLILPEVYLGGKDTDSRIDLINKTMQHYIDSGVFAEPKEEFMYVERTTSIGRVRRGLVAAIDLESYDWKPFCSSPIRATEATVAARIPPRKKIRQNAVLDIPHIMLLANDKERCLIEGIENIIKQSNTAPAYCGQLMLGGGRVAGWPVRGQKLMDHITESLNKIAFVSGDPCSPLFLFAAGDGNHSLAAAKAVWNEYKASRHAETGAKRYALVEIVNIYDEGLIFEPIHRVLFNVCAEHLVEYIKERMGGKVSALSSGEVLKDSVRNSANTLGFSWLKNGVAQYAAIDAPEASCAPCRLIQPVIDEFIKSENAAPHPIAIDYIHGDDAAILLARQAGAVAVLMPSMSKDGFFDTIAREGPFPRKSFSLGKANDKRFYLESRMLF